MNTFVTGGGLQAQLWSLKKGRSWLIVLRLIVLNLNAIKEISTAVCKTSMNFHEWTVNIKWKNLLCDIIDITSFLIVQG